MKQPAKTRRPRPVDSDNAWKELLDRHFADFLRFFFPKIHAAIDWSRKPVFLDKELPKLGPKHLRGDRLADKLAKVWRKTGEPLFVVVHSEIQGEPEPQFDQRMYVYHSVMSSKSGAAGRFSSFPWPSCRTGAGAKPN